MITAVPLPPWLLPRRRFADPTASWRRPDDVALVTGRTAWLLAALAHGLAARLGRAPRILLPAWICNQSLWPLRQQGAEPVFLPVGPDGAPLWNRAAALGAVDAVVVVHTFGQAADALVARAFADECRIPLIEDCAHVLRPTTGVGELGDVALYSPHKLLAIPDGALLVLRPRALGWADEMRANLDRAGAAHPLGRWLLRRLIQKVLPDGLRPRLPPSGQPDAASDPQTVPMPGPFAPSAYSLRAMAAADLDAEATARRNNTAGLWHALAGLGGWRPFFSGPVNAPYRLALLCDDGELAARRYAALRRARLPVETWPDLPPEVRSAAAMHAEGALDLRRRLLLLPVHGSLDASLLPRVYGEALA
jgi:hypothetical protein